MAYNLRLQRKARDKSQEQMAAICGISYRLYQNLETAKGNPTLASLDSIARAIQVTVAELIRLRAVQARGTREDFLAKYKETFLDSTLAAGVRTHDGLAIWANRKAVDLHGQPYREGPVDLGTIFDPTARQVLLSQLECERRDQVQSYLNTTRLPSGEKRVLRYYPTTVFPSWGGTPFFGAVYMSEPTKDSESSYFDYCESLLGCV